MSETEALKQKLVPYKSEVARIKEVFAAVAAEAPVEDSSVAEVLARAGYIEYDEGRIIFTEKGRKFHAGIKKFA